MREVLFIAYWFPPMGGSGVVRPLKFAKYLPQFGWKPTILTVTKGDSFVFDDTLLRELPDQVTIERAPSLEILKTTRVKNISDRLKASKKRNGVVGPLGIGRRGLARFLKAMYFSPQITHR